MCRGPSPVRKLCSVVNAAGRGVCVQVEDIRGRLLEAKLQNVKLKTELQSRREALEGGLYAALTPPIRRHTSCSCLNMLCVRAQDRQVCALPQDAEEVHEGLQRRLEGQAPRRAGALLRGLCDAAARGRDARLLLHRHEVTCPMKQSLVAL